MKVSRRRLHRSFPYSCFLYKKEGREVAGGARQSKRKEKYNFESYGKSEWIIFYLFESYENTDDKG